MSPAAITKSAPAIAEGKSLVIGTKNSIKSWSECAILTNDGSLVVLIWVESPGLDIARQVVVRVLDHIARLDDLALLVVFLEDILVRVVL